MGRLVQYAPAAQADWLRAAGGIRGAVLWILGPVSWVATASVFRFRRRSDLEYQAEAPGGSSGIR